MDCFLVLQRNDIPLFEILLHSYEAFYQSKNKFFVYAHKDDAVYLEPLKKITDFHILWKEDFKELSRANHGMLAQGYLKLISYRYASTPYFFLLDADFLFTKPCRDDDFFHQDRPYWFYRPYDKKSPAYHWKSGTDQYLAFDTPYLFMDTPQYIFEKSICEDLDKKFDCQKLLTLEQHTEYNVYGNYAFRYFPEAYAYQLIDGAENSICEKVNQIPPTYCELDANVTLSKFPKAKVLVFWSHWHLAKEKMISFFKEALQQSHISYAFAPNDFIFPLNEKELSLKKFNSIQGVYPDNWVSPTIFFRGGSEGKMFSMVFEVPGKADGTPHQITIDVNKNYQPFFKETFYPGQSQMFFSLQPGCSYQLNFSKGIYSDNPAEQRELIALIRNITICPLT